MTAGEEQQGGLLRPGETRTVQFPWGGASQLETAEWVREQGGTPHLWDGAVEELEDPAEDGSYFRWRLLVIGSWPHALRVHPGDHITIDADGEFTVTPQP